MPEVAQSSADVELGPFLFSTDVDGTLLTRDYKLLPDVRSAVVHAREHGIKIMLATARGPAALEVVLADLGEVDFAICFGGALVLCRKDGSWADCLGDQATIQPSELAQAWNAAATAGVAIGAYTLQGVHVGIANPWFENELGHTGEPIFVTDFQSITDPVFKLLAISDPERVQDLERLRLGLPAGLEGVYSHANYLEIMVRGVSKGHALNLFCQAEGFDRSSVVVTGDGDNDVSMFAAASHSAAMANASSAAKAAADWTVEAGEMPGVAAVIEHYSSSLWRIPAPSTQKSE